MSQMKRVVLPILEEINDLPGSRMEVFKRVNEPTEWGRSIADLKWPQFKRIISHLVSTGMINVETDNGGRLTLTPEGQEAIGV